MSVERSCYLYELPEELIARHPVFPRDRSRLLILDRRSGEIRHSQFTKFADMLEQGSLLVVNNSKVIPARISGKRKTGGLVDVLLAREQEPGVWLCKVKNSARLKPGESLELAAGEITAEMIEKTSNGDCLLRFDEAPRLFEKLERYGSAPLPPYILKAREAEVDREIDLKNYQTIFGREYGAIAAPTAGFHFTPEALARLNERDIEVLEVTLHVGLGTFEPMRVEDIRKHKMHEERYFISETVAGKINCAKNSGRRIVAVGTTVTRTLESAWSGGELKAGNGVTRLFIYPPYRFEAVDRLLTNFHLPGSTLIMLVAAFAGKNFTLRAYREAIKERYRFYSYGDCMFVI